MFFGNQIWHKTDMYIAVTILEHFLLEKCEALNLFFCFRWLLIWFKREFEWVDIMRLWEVLFSDHLSTQFHLFVAMAILDKHRDVMMDHLQGFDEILKVYIPTCICR